MAKAASFKEPVSGSSSRALREGEGAEIRSALEDLTHADMFVSSCGVLTSTLELDDIQWLDD